MGNTTGDDSVDDYKSLNPADRMARGIYSAPKSGIGGLLDPKGTEMRTPVFDTRETVSRYDPDKARSQGRTGLNANYVDVPNPNYGRQVGYTSAANLPGVVTGLATALNGGVPPEVYTGDNRFNPFGDPYAGGGSGDGAGGYRAAFDPLAAARQRRADAFNARNKALAEAFVGFDDNYYSDLESAFRDVNAGSVQSQYDDALRGIYQGFKQQGLFDQGAFDSQVAALNAQKAKEEARIGTAAKEFADAQRQAVADQRSKLASSLSGILGGATTEAEIDAQIGNINRFNFDNDIAKLKAAGPTEASMDMFTDFNKVAAPTVTGQAPANVAPISPSAFGGANQLVNTSGVSGASTGVASPFSGSSARIV